MKQFTSTIIMKKYFKTALFIALGSFVLTSCMDSGDEIDTDAQNLKIEQELESLLAEQKIKIETYKNEFIPNAVEDTLTLNFTRLNKKIKRGIWYLVESEPTDNSYTYSINSSGNKVNYPKLKLKYTAKLLNNTVVESDLVGTDYNFEIPSNKITSIWLSSFFPYSTRFNGNDIILGGLTKDGLKKGSKFKVITPSYFAYGPNSQGNIPANSPLVYEFEVLEINN